MDHSRKKEIEEIEKKKITQEMIDELLTGKDTPKISKKNIKLKSKLRLLTKPKMSAPALKSEKSIKLNHSTSSKFVLQNSNISIQTPKNLIASEALKSNPFLLKKSSQGSSQPLQKPSSKQIQNQKLSSNQIQNLKLSESQTFFPPLKKSPPIHREEAIGQAVKGYGLMEAAQDENNMWEGVEKVLQEGLAYYQGCLGESLFALPTEILTSDAFQTQQPLDVVKVFDILDIGSREVDLYWVARLALALPLANEYVTIKEGDWANRIYLHKFRLTRIPVHPGLLYLKDIIRQVRKRRGLLEGTEGEPDHGSGNGEEKKTDSAVEPPEKLNSLQSPQYQEFISETGHLHRIDLYILRIAFEGDRQKFKSVNHQTADLVNVWLENVLEAASSRKAMQGLQGMALPGRVPDNLTLDVCRQVGVDLETEAHLIGVVTNYLIDMDNVTNGWRHRNPSPLVYFWVNAELRKAQSEFPHLSDLGKKLEQHRQGVAKGVRKALKEALGEETAEVKAPKGSILTPEESLPSEALLKEARILKDPQKLNYVFKIKDAKEIKASVLNQQQEIAKRSLIKKAKNLAELGEFKKEERQAKMSKKKANQKQQAESEEASEENSLPPEKKPNFFSDFFKKRREEKQLKEKEEKRRLLTENLREVEELLGEDVFVNF